jgi:hypothetical protein
MIKVGATFEEFNCCWRVTDAHLATMADAKSALAHAAVTGSVGATLSFEVAGGAVLRSITVERVSK